jgi:hypothetical protein
MYKKLILNQNNQIIEIEKEFDNKIDFEKNLIKIIRKLFIIGYLKNIGICYDEISDLLMIILVCESGTKHFSYWYKISKNIISRLLELNINADIMLKQDNNEFYMMNITNFVFEEN